MKKLIVLGCLIAALHSVAFGQVYISLNPIGNKSVNLGDSLVINLSCSTNSIRVFYSVSGITGYTMQSSILTARFSWLPQQAGNYTARFIARATEGSINAGIADTEFVQISVIDNPVVIDTTTPDDIILGPISPDVVVEDDDTVQNFVVQSQTLPPPDFQLYLYVRTNFDSDSSSRFINMGLVNQGDEFYLVSSGDTTQHGWTSISQDTLLAGVTWASKDSLELHWTAPGDDGWIGTSSEYDLRYASATITDVSWPSANQFPDEPTPQPAYSQESYVVKNLPPGGYYFAIKTRDEAYNWSPLSNNAYGVIALNEGRVQLFTVWQKWVPDVETWYSGTLGPIYEVRIR